MSAAVAAAAAFSYLFSHRLRIGDSGAEESIPFQPAIQTGPVIVSVSSVGQAPGDECVELSVSRLTLLHCKPKHQQYITVVLDSYCNPESPSN